MSKQNLTLGTALGKLGDIIYYRIHGQQRQRAYYKKSFYPVNYEQARRQAFFANARGVYNWLPDVWRKACATHRVGYNYYADFMQQYNRVARPSARWAEGFGRFQPADYALTRGTLDIPLTQAMKTTTATTSTTYQTYLQTNIDMGSQWPSTFGAWWRYVVGRNPWLREGDIMHIVFGVAEKGDGLPANRGDIAEATLPPSFAHRLQLDLKIDFDDATNIGAYDNYIYLDPLHVGQKYFLIFKPTGYMPVSYADQYRFMVVGAVMIERPSELRTRRFSFAPMCYNFLLSGWSTVYATYAEAAIRSYIKEP